MLTAVLFTIAEMWNQLTCPMMNECGTYNEILFYLKKDGIFFFFKDGNSSMGKHR